jgi:hypothetical protein
MDLARYMAHSQVSLMPRLASVTCGISVPPLLVDIRHRSIGCVLNPGSGNTKRSAVKEVDSAEKKMNKNEISVRAATIVEAATSYVLELDRRARQMEEMPEL